MKDDDLNAMRGIVWWSIALFACWFAAVVLALLW